MKRGHSILLGEIVDAALLSYDDCRAWQVVCPACHEPIFKAVREALESVHYLSHYPAAQAYAPDCELRVARLDEREIERGNIESRGQKLALYLQVLRSTILAREYANSSGNGIKSVMRSKALRPLREIARQFTCSFPAEDFAGAARHYIEQDVGADSPMWRTSFSMAVQQRIAWDIWRSIGTEVAAPNHDFLWCHGYIYALFRIELAQKAGTSKPPSDKLGSYMARLLMSSRPTGEALRSEMLGTPTPEGFAERGSNYLMKMMAEVSHEMIGCLLRLPYYEILQEQNQQARASESAH